jgi:uncharacterized protein Yka (UPF0111/DUF47 family)
MTQETPPLFGKTKFLEGQIDEFLDKIAEGSIYFENGLRVLIDQGATAACEEKLLQMLGLQERCNELRRSVANTLYTEMLIPDFRGNVLSLLSNLYGLLRVLTRSFQEFMIEHATTSIAADEKVQIEALTGFVVKSIQSTIIAARAFFRNPPAVRDHIYEIRVFATEAGKAALRIKKRIFTSSMPLERMLHARDSIDIIASIADMAEEISDELSIYAIKRVL